MYCGIATVASSAGCYTWAEPLGVCLMTTVAFHESELNHLLSLALELHEAGRLEGGAAVARAFVLLREMIQPERSDADADLDPEFIRDMEEAEEDIAAGRLIPHEDVMRRLQALDDA